MKRRIVTVSAGLGVPSSTRLLADRLSAAIQSELEERGTEVAVEHIELRELAHELTDNLLTGFPRGKLVEALEAVQQADGLIAVTPVFSASYSGLFKTFFDVLDEGVLTGKPVLMAATAGTERHSLVLEYAMRPLFSYLKADIVPTAVFAAASDWGSSTGALQERVERAAKQLGDLVENQKSSAGAGAEFIDFATMLGTQRQGA